MYLYIYENLSLFTLVPKEKIKIEFKLCIRNQTWVVFWAYLEVSQRQVVYLRYEDVWQHR